MVHGALLMAMGVQICIIAIKIQLLLTMHHQQQSPNFSESRKGKALQGIFFMIISNATHLHWRRTLVLFILY